MPQVTAPVVRNIVVDCHDPVALATFWAAVLGWQIEPVDAATRARLTLERGIDAAIERITLAGSPGEPRLYFQRVDDPTPGKNRLHLDLEVDDAEAEVARLLPLGAREPVRMTEKLGELEERWIVLSDPEGNVFCLQSAGSPQLP
jgi:predicted enzyme related to lactoylglutathione lyase